MGTWIVGTIVAILIGAIVISLIKKKKAGKSIACNCECKECPSSSMCHKK